MGDALNVLDLSNYINRADNMVKNSNVSTALQNDNIDSKSSVETIDFGRGSNNFSNSNSASNSSDVPAFDTTLTNVPSKDFKFEEKDDFSSNQYSEYILNQYMNKYGDVDGDGVVSIKDITTIQQQLSNNSISSTGAGDINCDGKVDDNDIALMQQYLSGNGVTPANIEMANKMDNLKYSHTQSQTANELHDKNVTLQKIKNSRGYHKLDNEIKTKQENSHGNRLIKNKEKGYMHYVNKNNNSNKNTNTNKLANSNPFGANEAGQKKNTMYNIYKNNKLTAAEEDALIKEFGSLEAAQSAYEMNVASLNYSKKELDKQVDLVPYNNLTNTADFKKWANSKLISDFDPNNNPDLANNSKYNDSYKYLSVGQLAMYNYLLETKSKEEADKYLDLYQDDINKAIGLERSNKFIDQLDKDFSKIIREDGSLMDDTDIKKLQNLLDNNQYDKTYDINGDGKLTDEDMSKLKQYIETGGEIETTFKNMGISFGGGFQDGWNKFFEGFKYVFDDSAVLSPEEYKMMFIAQKLEQNGVIKSSYEFGQTVGNMTPVILASAIATAATAPFGGEGGAAVFGTSLSAQQIGQYTAAALIFTSTYGNSKHEALCNGHSLESAIGFAVLSGLSEAGLETLLGSIPGVGKECENIFVGMFKEGLSESAQELVGTMIGYYTLGEEIDVSDLSASMGKAFIYGALLSGASNGFASGIKIVVNGVKYTLTRQQIMDYYNASIDPVTGENNGLSIQEYLKNNVNPSSANVNTTPTPESLIQDYTNNIDEFARQGISLESYLADKGIDIINPYTRLDAAESLGDSKLYALERLCQIRDSGNLSSAKIDQLDNIISKYTGMGNGSYTIDDILKDSSSFLTHADKKKIKSISKNGAADSASSSYTYNQRAAIYNYTKCGGFEINGWLNNTTASDGIPWRYKYSSIEQIQDLISGYPTRNGRNMVFPASSGDIVTELDNVIANSNYDTPIETYRGLKDLYDGNTKIDPMSLKPGDSFTSAGYQSSSVVFENCYANKDGYDIILDIIVPPNSGTAAYIENSSGVCNYGQMEMLIKRNATMTVTGDPYLQNINGTNKLVVPVIVQ